jgi:hypothetical protein
MPLDRHGHKICESCGEYYDPPDDEDEDDPELDEDEVEIFDEFEDEDD